MKLGRIEHALASEGKEAWHLLKFDRNAFCVSRSHCYGDLLGKSMVALLILVVRGGVIKKGKGCVPGPGARSGLQFV